MGNVIVGFGPVSESVDGSDRVFGNDKEVSDEISIGSFTKFGSPLKILYVNQCESLCDEVGG